MPQRLPALGLKLCIARKDQRRVVAGGAEIFAMRLDAGDAEARHAALSGAEQVAFAAQPQILLGDAKTVLAVAQNGEARLGGFPQRRLVQKQAGRMPRPAADAAAQLMQLRQPETFRVLDDHDGCFRHVDADFDHRGGDQELCLTGGKALHRSVLVGAFHPPVHQIDACPEGFAQLGKTRLGGSEIDLFRLVDQRADPIDALAFVERAADRRLDLGDPRQRNGAGVDGLAAGRLLAQFGHVHVAEISEHQRARNRRRGKHQHVHRVALLRQRQPLVHAEAVLFVDDGQGEIVERHLVLKQRMGAEQQVDVAEREPVEDFRARAAALAPGEDGDVEACGLGQRRDGGEMLAGEQLGRRHERRLPAGLDHRRRGEQRHHRLAGADIALQQPQHALGQSEIVDDVVERLLLRMGERIGQAFQDARAQGSGDGGAAAGLAAHMCAQQRQRQLAGEQFVIGKPRPGQTLGRHVVRLMRPMQIAQRVGEGGKALARDPRPVLPFRQTGQAGQRTVHCAPHIAQCQALGERIDRLHQRQLGKARFVDHPVRMHHLQHAVVKFGSAGDEAQLARRQELLQVVLARVEKCERQRAGVVAGDDPVGRARPVRRRRTVLLDGHRHRDDRAGLHIAQLGAGAPVDSAGRQMKQQVDDTRRRAIEQPLVKLLELRPDAGKAGERGEEGVEQVRPHGHDCSGFRGRAASIALFITGLIPVIPLRRTPCVPKRDGRNKSGHDKWEVALYITPARPRPGFWRWSEPMSGTRLSSDGLDERRRRLLFRSWHRGIREMDFILGRFADAHLPTLTDVELDEYERWLLVPDQQIYAWVNGSQTAPTEVDTALFGKLRAFHSRGPADR